MRKSLDAYRLPSDYRKQCADRGQHDRAIAFFAGLVASQTNHWRARLELSCAYVDKIPTCTGVAAVMNQGALARKALDQADLVVAHQPGLWVGYYVRGMNHLHWPRAFRHSDEAVRDFQKCLELQTRSGGPTARDCCVRLHVALGDAQVKAGRFQEARRVWQDGLKSFPNAKEIQARLAVAADEELLNYVQSERSLDKPVDTSLGFLDEAADSTRPARQ